MGSSCDFSPVPNGVVVSIQSEDQPKTATSATIQQPFMSMVTKQPTVLAQQQQPVLAASPGTIATTTKSTLKISCRPCGTTGPEGGARAFVMGPTPLSIVLCSNRLSLESTEEMNQVLVHELIHIYDVVQLKLDLRTCVNLAYSEIRAAREAECLHSWFPQKCIQKKAMTATYNLFPQEAGLCISQAYNSAMLDRRPFGSKTTTSNNDSRHSER
jgi:hypothetical protein